MRVWLLFVAALSSSGTLVRAGRLDRLKNLGSCVKSKWTGPGKVSDAKQRSGSPSAKENGGIYQRVKDWTAGVTDTARRVFGGGKNQYSPTRPDGASSERQAGKFGRISQTMKDATKRLLGHPAPLKRRWRVVINNRNDFLFDTALDARDGGGIAPGPSTNDRSKTPGPFGGPSTELFMTNVDDNNNTQGNGNRERMWDEGPPTNIFIEPEVGDDSSRPDQSADVVNHESAGSLTYRSATDLFVLNDDSPLFEDSFFLPLAVMANLSLTRTWSSRAGGLFLRRKYAPRWEAFMKPLLKFVDRLTATKSSLGDGSRKQFALFLEIPHSCSEGGNTHHQALMHLKLAEVKKKHHPYHGTDPGRADEWNWDEAVDLGKEQLECGYSKWMRQLKQAKPDDTYGGLLQKEVLDLSTDLTAAMLAKAGKAHKFLTLLSKDLPEGWKFTRGKMGLFRRGLSWLSAKVNGDQSNLRMMGLSAA